MADGREHIRWDIVEEHLDEAEFLLTLWEAGLESPGYTLDELARGPEHRLRVHVDALAIGGIPVADTLLWPKLAADAELRRLTAVACLALLREPDPAALDRVLTELVGLEPGPARDGIATALTIAPRNDVSARVFSRVERGPEPERTPLLTAIAMRGGSPGAATNAWVVQAVADAEPTVRETAATLSGWCGRATALRVAERLVTDTDTRVRVAALETALIHGSPGAHTLAIDIARGRIVADAPVVRASMVALALTGEPASAELLVARLGDEAAREHAIWALGFCGRPPAVDALLPLLADKKIGPLAAEAIVGITGIGRDDSRFWEPGAPLPPVTDEEIEGALPAEELGADLGAKPEDELPIPIPPMFASAWSELRPRLDARQRFGDGRPLVHANTYAEILGVTSTRRRHAIALELGIRTRGLVRIGTRGLSAIQRPQLAVLDSAGVIDGARPYARIS